MKLWTKVYLLVFKMPEDIKIKGDKPIRVFTKNVTHMHVTKGKPTRYGVTVTPTESDGRRYALNLEHGLLFDLDMKLMKKLNYKTAFHKFIAHMKPYAWYSFYYEGTARLTAFMFTNKADRDTCVEYFNGIYYPRFIRKHNRAMIADATRVKNNAQERIDQLQAELDLYLKTKPSWN